VVVAAMLLLLLLALSAFCDGGRRMQLLKVRRAIKLGACLDGGVNGVNGANLPLIYP
jgi:hypothetical protein